MFDSVAVANRGEIAVRVIRSLRALGIRSVAMFTDPDRDALHVRLADQAVGIGPRAAYLDVDAVVGAAVRAGAEALHPGYGFLSENPALAAACSEAGLVFVGPPVTAIVAMGDKINAKRLVSSAGVPVVPGVDGRDLEDAQLEVEAARITMPVLLKPSAGGGGKGMRRVDNPDGLRDAIAAARREAISAFGDGTLLVEKFVERPRHIEIQVLADNHGNVVALGERECSLQRRHQKIVEETPSPLLDAATRSAMEDAAVAAAKACGYSGAGTVEFIVSAERPTEFFFMEMNTRLQVEHPVTEMVRDLDLVEWQLKVAAGEPLPWVDGTPVPAARGHAVEARIYAEDPTRGFLPASGTVRVLREPSGTAIRVDTALFEGTVVGTEYDPMLAKVIAWGSDRTQAIGRLRDALENTAVAGVTTNVGFLVRLLDQNEVVSGEIDTGLVDRVVDAIAAPGPGWLDEVGTCAATVQELLGSYRGAGPWEVHDGWRVSDPAPRTSTWRVGGDQVDVTLEGPTGDSSPARIDGDELRLVVDGRAKVYAFAAEGDTVWLSAGGDSWTATLERETIDRAGPSAAADGPLTSPMPGTVLAVHAAPGETVAPGQALVTVEAMKMEHVVTSPSGGVVERVFVAAGQSVALGQPLALVTAADPT